MTEIERCERCSAVIALVGIRHNCVPKVQTAALKGNAEVRLVTAECRTEAVAKCREPRLKGATTQPVGIKPGPSDAKLGRPRLEDAQKTLKKTEPWKSEGMSRTTWFRRQAEKRAK